MRKSSYSSPEIHVSGLKKKLPGVFFYYHMISIILHSYKKAKRGKYSDKNWVDDSQSILNALESVGVKFRWDNLSSFQNLQSPCIFVCNHMSTLETFVLPCILGPHEKVTFVVKKSLTEYPVFKHIMNSRNPIVVGRVNPRDDFKMVLSEGKKRIDNGISLIIFPQTTRSNDLDPQKFNTMGVKLAKHAQVPVIPVALKTDAWGVGKIIKDFGKIDPGKSVRFSFGKPIYIKGNGKDEHKETVMFIRSKLDEWRS